MMKEEEYLLSSTHFLDPGVVLDKTKSASPVEFTNNKLKILPRPGSDIKTLFQVTQIIAVPCGL